MLCGVRLALFAALLLAAALPTAAEAATITYTNEFNPTQPLTSRGWCDVNSGGAGNTWCYGEYGRNSSFATSRFDSSLGQLKAVAFEVFIDRAISAEVQCTTQCPNATSNAVFTFDIFLSYSPTRDTDIALMTIGGNSRIIQACPTSCLVSHSFSGSDLAFLTEDLEEFTFEGGGTMRFRFHAFDTVRGSTDITPMPINTGTGRIETTYYFTPVPEPGTAVLLAAGLLFLGRRRRQP